MLNASFLLFTGKFQPCKTAVWLPMAISSRVLEMIADEMSVVITKESDTGMVTISKKHLDCFYCIAFDWTNSLEVVSPIFFKGCLINDLSYFPKPQPFPRSFLHSAFLKNKIAEIQLYWCSLHPHVSGKAFCSVAEYSEDTLDLGS